MFTDRSLKFNSTQYTPKKNKRTKQLLIKEDTLNISPILNETSIFKTLNDTSLRQVLDESSIIVNKGNAGDGLTEAFFKIIQSGRPSNVLDTVARLSQVCCESLELVEPWNRYNTQNYWLAEEANTWKLLHCLYGDSIAEHPNSIEDIILEPTLSQSNLVDGLYQCDSELRLLQLLVDWLEETAAYQDEATKTATPVIGNNVQWENTLHQLLFGASLFNKETNKVMVTCMDPDAPRRQNKALHTNDTKDDNDLCKRVFTEIRCGKFNEAISLCLNAGQAWRAAALQGWKLLNYTTNEEQNGSTEVSGNAVRDLWKWCTLDVANNTSENLHYRATMGVLCGHLSSVLPACHGNWEDLLWAHLRVQIETRIDKFLHEHHLTAEANTTAPGVLELLQSELHVDEISLQNVFSAVKALMDGKKESNYQICQRHLMLGNIRNIMQVSLQWLHSAEERFIRFLAHLILILRQMGKDPQHDVGDQILEKYVTQLIEGQMEGACECPNLIAFYTSTVPINKQTVLYAELMDKTLKCEHKEGVVTAGTEAGIDVADSARIAIKKAITDIHEGYGNMDSNCTRTTTVEKDKKMISKVISSLEWLSLINDQLQEALWLSNNMIRMFILIGNTEAAMSCIKNIKELFPNFLNKISPNASEVKEHLCLKAYLESLEAFASWYRHFISGQPKDIEPLAPDALFSDKVHYEQRVAHVEQQKIRWKNAILHQSRHTKDLLYNVLLFPGGWLQDESDSFSSENFTKEEEVERNKQLDTLRRLCIPEITVLILKTLQSTDDISNHREALKIIHYIADENRGLYKVFTKNKLLEVLDRIKESSLLLLEKGMDIFGSEITDE